MKKDDIYLNSKEKNGIIEYKKTKNINEYQTVNFYQQNELNFILNLEVLNLNFGSWNMDKKMFVK